MTPSKYRYLVFVPVLLGGLAGCSGVDAVANHSNLDVHTHMSETIFLDPVPARLRTVYIGVRNTSDYPGVDLRGPLAAALSERGYTIVSDPDQAHYLLQANVLQAGKLADGQEQALLGAQYGQPLLAGATAGGLAAGFGGNTATSLGVGLGVAAGTSLFNYAFQNVTYAVTVDIQLSERPLHGGKILQHSNTYRSTSNQSSTTGVTDSTAQTYGTSTSGSYNSNDRSQSFDETSDFKKYNIRDIAYANKVNLQMEQAIPVLVQRLSSSFANLFE